MTNWKDTLAAKFGLIRKDALISYMHERQEFAEDVQLEVEDEEIDYYCNLNRLEIIHLISTVRCWGVDLTSKDKD